METAGILKGYIHVYTGNGKGKTTAAIGLAIRACGAGLKTCFFQFMKNYPYSEIKALEKYSDKVTLLQFCTDDFVFRKEMPPKSLVDEAAEGLKTAKEKMLSGEYNLIILDEALVSIYFKLLTTEQLLEFIGFKPENVELVLTGRYAPQEIIDKADLVTEMKEVKHYYNQGVLSRKGIES